MRTTPNFQQVSVLAATLSLTFLLAKLISFPGGELSLAVLGILVDFRFNVNTVTAVLAAGLSATGTFWLVQHHPSGHEKQFLQFGILPALSAWVLSVILWSLPLQGLWWMMLALGVGLLILIWTAEFVLVEPRDVNFRIALSGISTITFILFFALAANLRAADIRLVFLIPSMSVAAGLLTIRFLFLRLQGASLYERSNIFTAYFAALTTLLVTAQVATAGHFLPFSPVAFGLLVTGPAFAANVFFANMVEERPRLRTIWEPILILAGIWLLALWLN